MKKYKLLKDWDGCKAGTVGFEQENGNIGFTKTYKTSTWVIRPERLQDAIRDGLIEEIEEVKFKNLKKRIKDVVESSNKVMFDVEYTGLEIMIFTTDNSFAIEIQHQGQEWYELKHHTNPENGIVLSSHWNPHFSYGNREGLLALRGDDEKLDYKLITYSDTKKGKAKQILYEILVALKYTEEYLFNSDAPDHQSLKK